ncbi:uncharacterized protein [Epargyreus clarus]
MQLRSDNDAAFFKKTCLTLPVDCNNRWWALESTPGYFLNSESSNVKVILNTTIQQCYEALLSTNDNQKFRSAQWIQPDNSLYVFSISNVVVGNCILNAEDKFTEPEAYRVSNYYTFYVENQCRYDYPKKIERCSYEEYYNQTLKHVDLTFNNVTKDECKKSCEVESRFVCRGFTWTMKTKDGIRGLCDLHSEDLVTMGSWLLRRVSAATYYRRVICLNISVECEGSDLIVTYRPRGVFRGRVYVPGQPERCSARATGAGPVKLKLPLYGDCDVNFAYAITKGPNGVVNRTMAYAMLMIQNNPIIQTAGDRWVRVGCSPGTQRDYTKVDATIAVHDSGPSLASEWSVPAGVGTSAGASAVFGSSGALSVYIVRAHGERRPDAVALGEPLEFRIDTTDEVEIEAYHLVASSRLGDNSVLLLDSKGCPTGQVDFPSFTRTYIGGTQRLSAVFKAFRFPSSKVVRFALVVRYCDGKCDPINCSTNQPRAVRGTYDTDESNDVDPAASQKEEWPGGVVAQGGAAPCAAGGAGRAGRVPLELELLVGAGAVLSADTLVRADHRAADETLTAGVEGGARAGGGEALVCVHELLLVALALAWLAVQLLLLLGCCVLVKRYRNLAEMNMQKDYHSFDNVGFDNISTHRRVHWPDQNIDILHAS